MTDALLSPNKWSRSQKPMIKPCMIVLHWLLNAGQSARDARLWWEGRKDGDRGYGAGHIIVDDHETLLCVPLTEVAYHVGILIPTPFAKRFSGIGGPNYYAIGVEMTHQDWTGKPTDSVWERTVKVCKDLCMWYNIPINMIVTHWDVTGMQEKWNGKPCHRWFVEQPGEMARFQNAVREAAA